MKRSENVIAAACFILSDVYPIYYIINSMTQSYYHASVSGFAGLLYSWIFWILGSLFLAYALLKKSSLLFSVGGGLLGVYGVKCFISSVINLSVSASYGSTIKAFSIVSAASNLPVAVAGVLMLVCGVNGMRTRARLLPVAAGLLLARLGVLLYYYLTSGSAWSVTRMLVIFLFVVTAAGTVCAMFVPAYDGESEETEKSIQ